MFRYVVYVNCRERLYGGRMLYEIDVKNIIFLIMIDIILHWYQGFIQDFWLGGEEIPTVHVWACMR